MFIRRSPQPFHVDLYGFPYQKHFQEVPSRQVQLLLNDPKASEKEPLTHLQLAAVRAGRPSPQAPPGPQRLGEHLLQLPWQVAHAAPMDSSAGHAQNSPAALWGGWMDDDTTPNVDFFPFFFLF